MASTTRASLMEFHRSTCIEPIQLQLYQLVLLVAAPSTSQASPASGLAQYGNLSRSSLRSRSWHLRQLVQ